MKYNQFQLSIAKARAKMHEARRLAGVMIRHIKADNAKAETNLELLLDEIAAETGLSITTENMPTIMIYVEQFIKDQQQRKEEADGDDGGMEDLP